MFRLRHHDWVLRRARASSRKSRTDRSLHRRQFRLEPLEPRCLLSSQPWVLQGPAPTFNGGSEIPPNFPVSGAVQVAAPDPTNPDTLYIGAVNGGVWKTTNATAPSPTWTPLTDSLPSQSIASMSFDPTDPTHQTLIVGTGLRSSFGFLGGDEVGLYYTTDGGSSWRQFNQSILRDESFYGVAARGDVLLAGSASDGIFRSTNGGASWNFISGTNGLPNGGIYDLVGDPGNVDRFYAAVVGSGVFRSDDAGDTWTDVTTGITGAAGADNIRIGVHDSGGANVVYVGVVDSSDQLSGVFRSTNQGGNWTAMDVPSIHPGQQGYIHFSLAADPTNPNLVFLGGDSIDISPFTGILVRGDASLPLGSQFTSIVDTDGGNTSPHADSRYLGFDANGNLLDGDDGGIYRRSNPTSSGGTWSSVIGNLAITEVHDVAWDAISHTAIIGTQDNGVQQQRTPAGTTIWDALPTGDGGDVAVDNVSLASSNRAIRYFSSQYLGKADPTDNTDVGDFQREVIDGSNNVISTTAIDVSSIIDAQFSTPIKINAVNPLKILVGGASDLYESSNQGNTFTNIGGPGVNGDMTGDPIVYGGFRNGVANANLIYVGSGDTVFKRTAANGSFTDTALPGDGSDVSDITINPNDWMTVFAIDDDEVFMSTNAGGVWTDITGNLTSISSLGFRSLAFVPSILDGALVIGTRSGIFVSNVSTIGTWEQVGTGLPGVLVADLEYNITDDVLVAGTLGRGVWTFANATSELIPGLFPFGDTFTLHSNPGASKTIYLDFNGQQVRNTPWNNANYPNVIGLPFDLDNNLASFSRDELQNVQVIWDLVSQDFLPFDVDVTTEDPGVEALKNTGGGDTQWGQRVVIGDTAATWYTTVTGSTDVMAEKPNSFFNQVSAGANTNDTMAFVFAKDIAPLAGASPLYKVLAEVVSHVVGTTLGLNDAGQTVANPNPPPAVIPAVYPGHGTGATGWAAIMGTAFKNSIGPDPNNNLIPGFGKSITQWSQGEYQFATTSPPTNPFEDELKTITNAQTGVTYRADDQGDTTAAAGTLGIDSSSTTNEVVFIDSGIIGEHPSAGVSDADLFKFTVDGLGGILSLDISPAVVGPNLDILAKILDSSGNVLFTSNPRDQLFAGSQSLGSSSAAAFDPTYSSGKGGWRDPSTGDYTDTLFLVPGTYYLSVQGTGRPQDLSVNPTDWGYSNYGSLGDYTIEGTLSKGLVIGVDFDTPGAAATDALNNWNLYSGNANADNDTLQNLISETGDAVPYQLFISSSGPSIGDAVSTTDPIDSVDLPEHAVPLDIVDGYIPIQDQTLTFTWTNLEPWTDHQIYVFGHADFESHNVVTVTGGNLNGTVQTISFTQVVPGDDGFSTHLLVNSGPAGTQDLSAFAINVLSDGSGTISISVTNEAGFEAGIAGLAIVSTRPIGPAQNGSISGQKWNDLDGSQTKNSGEPGLQGFIIYLDENNNGQLDQTTTTEQTITVNSPDVPQSIPDYSTVKSELNFPTGGTIEDVNVALDISHTYDSDLTVYLVGPPTATFPDGQKVKLFANVGLDGHNFHNTVFDDTASQSITTGSAPFTGTFRPQEALSAFNGQDALGKWHLEISDDSLGDTGVVNSWSLSIKVAGSVQYLETYTTTDISGNYSFTNLSPGLYHVREYIQPDQLAQGWRPTSAPSPITVRSGEDVQGVDFGNWIPTIVSGSIGGQKYYDVNQNGVKDSGERGLPGWIIYVDSNNNGVRDVSSTPTVISSTDVPKQILDLQKLSSQVTVGSIGTVFKISVTLDITHSFMGDLDAYLVGPSTPANPTGRQIELFTDVGGQYNDFHNITLDDGAVRSIGTIGFNDLPYTGTWQPEGLASGHGLNDFIGDDAAGNWTLEIRDTATGDTGTLNSWSLNITTGELSRTTDANGNFSFDNLLSGTYNLREDSKPGGWVQVPPATTSIPGATWASSKWSVTVDGNTVSNVNFANYGTIEAFQGDFNGDGRTDGADYLLWRKSPSVYGGAAGYNSWRAHFGQQIVPGAGAGSSLSATTTSESSGTSAATSAAAGSMPTTEAVVAPVALESLQLGAATATSTAIATPKSEPIQVFPIIAQAASSVHDTIVYKPAPESTTRSDLGLMAWLGGSHESALSQHESFGTGSDSALASSGDDCESFDAAFETFEDSALAATAI
jgi:subtilisin-like proprotein convertase family protein